MDRHVGLYDRDCIVGCRDRYERMRRGAFQKQFGPNIRGVERGVEPASHRELVAQQRYWFIRKIDDVHFRLTRKPVRLRHDHERMDRE